MNERLRSAAAVGIALLASDCSVSPRVPGGYASYTEFGAASGIQYARAHGECPLDVVGRDEHEGGVAEDETPDELRSLGARELDIKKFLLGRGYACEHELARLGED